MASRKEGIQKEARSQNARVEALTTWHLADEDSARSTTATGIPRPGSNLTGPDARATRTP